MEIKHHLLNADGSYVKIYYDEPFGGTDEQYARFTQNETEQTEEALALAVAGKNVVGDVPPRSE